MLRKLRSIISFTFKVSVIVLTKNENNLVYLKPSFQSCFLSGIPTAQESLQILENPCLCLTMDIQVTRLCKKRYGGKRSRHILM